MKKKMISMLITTLIVSNIIPGNITFALSNENNPIESQVNIVQNKESVQTIPQADVFNVNFSNSTPNDLSLNKNQHTPVGNPAIEYSNVRNSNVATFNGSSAYIYKFDEKKYDDMRTQDGATIEATFKYDSIPTSGESDIFSNQQSGGIGLGLSKGKLQFYCNVNGSYKQPSIQIEAGSWYHAVGTFDGNVAKLYVNGTLVNSIEAKGNLTFTSNANAKNFVIGGDSDNNNGVQYFGKGQVESAKLYSKALSETEVKSVYENKNIPVISYEGDLSDMELNKATQLPKASSSNNNKVTTTIIDPNGTVVNIIDNKFTPTILGPYTFKYEVAISDSTTLVSSIKRNVISYENELLNFGIISSDSINPDAIINMNFHVNKSQNSLANKVEFDVIYDSNALTFENAPKLGSDVTVNEIEKGKLHVIVNSGINSADFVKYSDTLKARINFRANKDFTGTETDVKYENIKVIVNEKEINSNNLVQNKTLKIRTEKALDLNNDGFISVGDIAFAKSEDEAKYIAENSKIYPYKHVVIVTTDGAGVSFRPDQMYYTKSNLIAPKLTSDPAILAKRNNPYAMKLFNEIAATSYTAQSEMPAISAQNYSSILHGAEYDKLPSEYKIDNNYSGTYYFPDFEKDNIKYPSVFKTIKNSLPTSNTVAFAEWKQIVNGIIEPDSGANVHEVKNQSGISMGFYELADYIKSEDFKDTSLLYLQSDLMDSFGHSAGYYTDAFYDGLAKYDEYYETLMNSLVESDAMDDTLLIFNSDHGGTFKGHGSVNNSSDRDIQLAIIGDTIDSGKSLSGGTNHDISPLALHALRLDKENSMDGSAHFAKEAFLSQEKLVKKQRNIETLTAVSDDSVNTIQLTLGNTNEYNTIKTLDLVANISDNKVHDIITEGTVLRQKIEGEKLYLTISYENAKEDSLRIVFEDDIENCNVEEYMLGTSIGEEIYGDLINKSGEVTTANKDSLKSLINAANKLDKNHYTEESFKVLEDALTNAKDIIANKNSLQSEVDKACKSLKDSIDSLILKGHKPQPPTDLEDNITDDNGNTSKDNDNNSKLPNLPQTGSSAGLVTIVIGLITTILGALLLKNKRK